MCAFGGFQNDFQTPAGTQSSLFVNNNQALATLPGDGVGQNLISLAPCAINQPHVHPRGTEIIHITQGEMLFGFIEENANRADTAGGRFINATVATGQSFFIPQGLVHFGQNLQCTPAQVFRTLAFLHVGLEPDDQICATRSAHVFEKACTFWWCILLSISRISSQPKLPC
ncbi:hypothetical protein WJX82_002271 [Trebouxia sp. C0006]